MIRKLFLCVLLQYLSSCDSEQSFNDLDIFGGKKVISEISESKYATIGLFSRSIAYAGSQFAEIEGSATLISPKVAVGAAHTCLSFDPHYALAGPTTDLEKVEYVRISSCITHSDYQGDLGEEAGYSSLPSNDIALFYLADELVGLNPAELAPLHEISLPLAVSIVGFGSFAGQFDLNYNEELAEWESFQPFHLRRAESFISEHWSGASHFKDGPNPGIGSCQGDSGGSIYLEHGEQAYLLAMPVAGPACSDGVGYNVDLRAYRSWIFDRI